MKFLYAEPSSVDLVLLDLTMPGMGGEECYGRLRKHSSHVPILLISGYSASDWLRNVSAESNTSFLRKPFREAELKEAIRYLTEDS